MRISDWSSDVCSSDLVLDDEVAREVALEPLPVLERVVHLGEGHRARLEPAVEDVGDAPHHRPPGGVVRVRAHQLVDHRAVQVGDRHARSEEHTSELQSLMRISYAVFCLKKKQNESRRIRKLTALTAQLTPV